jgi:hypothetical protein
MLFNPIEHLSTMVMKNKIKKNKIKEKKESKKMSKIKQLNTSISHKNKKVLDSYSKNVINKTINKIK